MKKYSIFFFLLFLAQTHIIAQCEFDNPFEDLAWLQTYGSPDYRIIEYDYLGDPVFFVETCIGLIDPPDYELIDCEGNVLCAGGAWLIQISCDSYVPDLIHVNTWQEGIVSCVEYACNDVPFGEMVVDACGVCLLPNDPNFCSTGGIVEEEDTDIPCNGIQIDLPIYTSIGETVDYLILDEQDLILNTSSMTYEPRVVGVISGDVTSFNPTDYGFLSLDEFSIATVAYNLQAIKGMINSINPANCENICCQSLTAFLETEACGQLCNYYGICSGEDVKNFQEVIDFYTVFGAKATITGFSEAITSFNETVGASGEIDAICPGLSSNFPFYIAFSENTITYTCSGAPIVECDDPNACNYSPTGSGSNLYCRYPDCEGNCDGLFTGTAQVGNACDDGDANTVNDVWTADCTCVGNNIGDCLVVVLGCTDVTACNYNVSATVDDGSCVFDCTSIDCTLESALDSLDLTDFVLETYTVIEYEYLNQTTFFIESCDSPLDGLDYLLIDCQGNILCEIGGFFSGPGCGGLTNDLTYVQTIQEGTINCVEYDGNMIPILDDVVEGCTNPNACNYDPNATIDDGSCEFDCEVGGTLEAEETNIACNGTDIPLPTYTAVGENIDYLILDEQDLILVDTPNMIYEPRIVGVISGNVTSFNPIDYGFLSADEFSIATVVYDLQAIKNIVNAINPVDCESTCCAVLSGAVGGEVCGVLCDYYGICSVDDVNNFGEVIDIFTVFGAKRTISDLNLIINGFSIDEESFDVLNIICSGLPEFFPLYVAFSENTITYTCSDTPIIECTDPNACNYNPTGSTDTADCFYPDCEGSCNGLLTGAAQVGSSCNDGNGDTVNDVWTADCTCVGNESGCLTEGCTDETACNYDADANVDDGSCDFDCITTTINETICNIDTFFYELGYAGFEYMWAIYEQPQNGTLTISDDNLNLEYVPNTDSYGGDSFIIGHYSPIGDNYDSYLQFNIAVLGYCDFGCTDLSACNYNPNNTGEDGSCYLPDCAGICGGLSVYDDCGECLLPDDPNFNNCLPCSGDLDTTIINTTSCDYLAVGNDTMTLAGQTCDSTVITITTLLASDTTYITTSCESNIIGIDTIILTNAAGCDSVVLDIITGENPCNVDQDVWPGDVNYDGIANNEDVLYLGFKYGFTGSPRPNASTIWEAQVGDDWDDWQNIGENTKHADCDGNGTIAVEDMTVINTNYNLTHEVGKTNEDGIPIYVELPNELNASETIEAIIYLGDEEMTAEDFHGIAFSLEFSSEYVEEGSVSFDFNSELLGNENESVIGLDKVFHSEGVVDIGIAKIDMQSVNGHGRIATMSLVMIDDIIGKEDGNLPFTITVTNITALNSVGEEIEVADTTIQSEINTGLNENTLESTINIYPNPTTDYLYIDTQNQTIEFLQILNIQGQTLLTEKAQIQKVDVQELPNGTYFLKIQTQEGILLKKVQIIR